MASNFKLLKNRMAKRGYVTVSEYAKHKNIAKQYISRILHTLKVEYVEGRPWIKCDFAVFDKDLHHKTLVKQILNLDYSKCSINDLEKAFLILNKQQ